MIAKTYRAIIRRNAASFTYLIKSHQNPNRHVYMHNQFQDQYDDYFTVGEYPEAKRIATMIPSKDD